MSVIVQGWIDLMQFIDHLDFHFKPLKVQSHYQVTLTCYNFNCVIHFAFNFDICDRKKINKMSEKLCFITNRNFKPNMKNMVFSKSSERYTLIFCFSFLILPSLRANFPYLFINKMRKTSKYIVYRIIYSNLRNLGNTVNFKPIKCYRVWFPRGTPCYIALGGSRKSLDLPEGVYQIEN